jgi:hypothetical protein
LTLPFGIFVVESGHIGWRCWSPGYHDDGLSSKNCSRALPAAKNIQPATANSTSMREAPAWLVACDWCSQS